MKSVSLVTVRDGGLPAPRTRAAGEGGFLLVMVMVVMLVLSAIVASTLINSFLERSLAKNQNYASIALQATEGGIAAGMTWLRENQGTLPSPYTANPTWTQTLSGNFNRDLNADGDTADPGEVGGTYNVTLRFKREWRDVNGDGDCTDPGESSGYLDGDAGADGVLDTADDPSPASVCPGDIVLYNRCSGADQCFNFPDALYLNAGEGYPIIEIDATGTYGTGSFREIAMDVGRNRVDIQVEGAITARGPIVGTGSGYVDGHGFNAAGTAEDAACADLPAVTVDAGIAPPPCDADNDPANPPDENNPKGAYGNATCTAVHDPTAPGNRALGTNPWDIMGISEADFNALFTKSTGLTAFTGTAADPTYVWNAGDMHVNGGSGYGILVVHNEHFDPDVFKVSDPASAFYNTGHADYDARADSSKPLYDATYAPASLKLNGSGTYTGVIIADYIERLNGAFVLVGALISLAGANVEGDVSGNFTAKYSCDAVENALGGFGYGTKISWHRLR